MDTRDGGGGWGSRSSGRDGFSGRRGYYNDHGGFHQSGGQTRGYNYDRGYDHGRDGYHSRQYSRSNVRWNSGSRSSRGSSRYSSHTSRSHEKLQPDDLEYCPPLRRQEGGHTDDITSLRISEALCGLFSASVDGTVKAWDAAEGQLKKTCPLQAPVSCLHLEDGGEPALLFAGMKNGQIHVLDAKELVSKQVLNAHQGNVNCMAVAKGMLFSGGQDCAISVFSFDPSTGFSPAAQLTAAQAGHSAAVTRMQSVELPVSAGVTVPFLVSADIHGTLKVWELEQGSCTQTVQVPVKSPDPSKACIMGLVVANPSGPPTPSGPPSLPGAVLVGTMDGNVSVFPFQSSPAPGNVITATPQSGVLHPLGDRGGGVLDMVLAEDKQGRPVLVVSHAAEHLARMWQVPDWENRGELKKVHQARALAAIRQSVILAGDENGNIKIWEWR